MVHQRRGADVTAALAVIANVGGPLPVHILATPSLINHTASTGSQSDSLTLSATGGVAPYAFLTTVDTADAINLTNSATTTPTWGVTSMTPAEIRTGAYYATVTDAIGQTDTVSISVQFERT